MYAVPFVLLLAGAPSPSPGPEATTGHEHGFNGGAYLTLSTGANLWVAESGSAPAGFSAETTGGYLWSFPNRLKVSVGGGFKHRTMHLGARYGPSYESGWLAVVRVGAGTDRLWGYGLLSPAITMRSDPPTVEGGFSDAGGVLAFEAGGGVAAVVWRGLFVGGELTLDMGGWEALPRPEEGLIYLNARFVTGWSF
ncbi:MAG: hypothetical protein ACRBN8_32730 [Nannocystales bacterium]